MSKRRMESLFGECHQPDVYISTEEKFQRWLTDVLCTEKELERVQSSHSLRICITYLHIYIYIDIYNIKNM